MRNTTLGNHRLRHIALDRVRHCLSVYWIYWTCVIRGPFVQTLFSLWLSFKPPLRPRLSSIFPSTLLGRDAVCVDLALALVDRNLVFGCTGYLLLQLL